MKLFNLHSKAEAGSSSLSFKRIIIFSLILSMAVSYMLPAKISKAGTNQVNVQVNYQDETVAVTAGSGGSTKFFMSTDGGKNWEALDTTGIVDISGFLSTKEVVLTFKGNKDLIPFEVKLPAEDKSLQVSYTIKNGVGSITISTGTTSLPVEYRNGSNGTWRTAVNNMLTARYEIKGTTLYFRTVAAAGIRAGKVITIKISKRPTAPSVKLDPGKLCITGMKSGQTQYRIGDALEWQTFTPADQKATTIDLRTILNIPAGVAAVTGGAIELRTVGSDKKLHSAVKVIEILPQPLVPEQIALTGTTLTITDVDKKRAYEYTIVPKGSLLDLNKAKWSSASSSRAVVVKNASVGDKICVRLKSTTDSKTKQVILASTYKEFIVSSITIQ